MSSDILSHEMFSTGDDSQAAPSPPLKKRKYNAVKLNNNAFTTLEGLGSVLASVVKDPQEVLWIDLSFNTVEDITALVKEMPWLQRLYLHANNLSKFSDIEPLASLKDLKALTLHGNGVEDRKGYRTFVLSMLPQLKKLDFVTITRKDLEMAQTWARGKKK